MSENSPHIVVSIASSLNEIPIYLLYILYPYEIAIIVWGHTPHKWGYHMISPTYSTLFNGETY
jgi:hypothetical protein